jgi:DNA polymerase III alpha subunit (gram-positive type)
MLIAFVDTETTGLKAGVNRVIEAAVQLVDVRPQEMTVMSSFVLRQRVDLSMTPWSPVAMKINGYFDNPDWEKAPRAGTETALKLWRQYASLLGNVPLCSQNVRFDCDMIKAELAYFDLEPTWDRRAIDIQSFSAVAAIKMGLPKFGLHQVYDALGGPNLQEHRAMADIERGKFVFDKVARPFFAA